MIFFNELKKLCGRKQFLLLSFVLFSLQLFALFAFERNTEEYYYLYEHGEDARLEDQYEKDAQEGAYEAAAGESPLTWYEEQEQARKAYLEEYRVFITEMEKRAERISGSSVFSQNKYQVKDIKKTVKDYAPLKNTVLSSADLTAVKKYASYLPGILFEIIFVLLLVYFVFYEDKEKGYYPLLQSARKGHADLALSKLFLLMFITTAYVVLQEVSTIGLLSYFYGTGDLGAPVQSVPVFRNTALSVSVLQMYGLSVLYKALSMILVLTLFFFTGMLFGRIIPPLLITVGFCGLELLLWKVIRPTGVLRAVRYVNLFGLSVPSDGIGAYVNLKVFGEPVAKETVTLFLMMLLIVGFSLAGTVLFSLKSQVRREGLLKKLLLKLRTVFKKLQEGSSLLKLELYKMLIQQKKLLILGLLIFYAVSLIKNASLPLLFYRLEDAVYQYYAQKLSGPCDDVFIEKLEAEEDVFTEKQERLAEISLKLETEEPEEFDRQLLESELKNISYYLQTYSSGFSDIRLQAIMLDMKKEQDGKTHYFLNEKQYERYYLRTEDHLFEWLIAVLCVIFLTAGLYAMDEKNGMTRLIRSTVNGQKKIRHLRFFLMLLCVISAFLVIAVPDLIRFNKIDHFKCFGASFSDFTGKSFETSFTIGAAFITVMLLRFLSLFGFGYLSLKLSEGLKNEMTTVLVLAGICIIITVFGYLLGLDLNTVVLKIAGVSFRIQG